MVAIPEITPEPSPEAPGEDAESRSPLLDAYYKLQEQQPTAQSQESEPLRAPSNVEDANAEAQQRYSDAWERKSASSTPQTDLQIRDELAREGQRPETLSAEEAQAHEEKLQDEARQEQRNRNQLAGLPHSTSVHKPRQSKGRGRGSGSTKDPNRYIDGERII